MKYKVVIVDDHKIFRDGFKLAIRYIENSEFVGEASNGNEFIELLESVKPHIVFIDVNMPVMDGIKATRKALQKYNDIKIVALSSYCDPETIKQMIDAGVEGYMLKNAEISEFEKAIDEIMHGKNFFSQEVIMLLTRETMNKERNDKIKTSIKDISDREFQVLELICRGLGINEIAQQLHISERTVEKHKENLLNKTHSKNAINLVLWALRNQITAI